MFWLFFKYIISWEIRALKQYPQLLNIKKVWIVLEAISKTCGSCLTEISRHLETIKAQGGRPSAFICFSVSGHPSQTLALVFDILPKEFHCRLLVWIFHVIWYLWKELCLIIVTNKLKVIPEGHSNTPRSCMVEPITEVENIDNLTLI